eukprot:m.20249 g.20249  ORF g.20249 m.20249 type:complete len:577 (+) comp8840_c0_seq2:116-1846(+)
MFDPLWPLPSCSLRSCYWPFLAFLSFLPFLFLSPSLSRSFPFLVLSCLFLAFIPHTMDSPPPHSSESDDNSLLRLLQQSLIVNGYEHQQDQQQADAVDAEWFHGLISMKNAERLLLSQNAEDGLFLVRSVRSKAGTFVISVAQRGKLHHFPLHKGADGFALQSSPDVKFASISDLVDYYRDDEHGLPGPLLIPCLKDDSLIEPDTPLTTSPPTERTDDASKPARSNPFADADLPPVPPVQPVSMSQKFPTSVQQQQRQQKQQLRQAPAQQLRQQPAQQQKPARIPTTAAHSASISQQMAMEQPVYTPQVGLDAVRRFTVAEPLTTPKQSETPQRRGTLTGLRYVSDHVIKPGETDNPTGRELLLCEGYLTKLRGALQSKTRWFVLTSTHFAFYTENAGQRLSAVNVRDILSIEDLEGRKFKIRTRVQFGVSGKYDMLVEAPSMAAKKKWMRALVMDANDTRGFNSDHAELVVEGYLTKVQPLGTVSKTRWFRLTNKKFAYYVKEGGEELGAAPLDVIVEIAIAASKKEFLLKATQPFTKSGAFEVRCRCDSEAVRDKWVTGLRKVVPTAKFVQYRS